MKDKRKRTRYKVKQTLTFLKTEDTLSAIRNKIFSFSNTRKFQRSAKVKYYILKVTNLSLK